MHYIPSFRGEGEKKKWHVVYGFVVVIVVSIRFVLGSCAGCV